MRLVTGLSSAFQWTRKSKFPSSRLVILSQLWPRNGILRWPITTITSMILRIISCFFLILSSLDFEMLHLMFFFLPGSDLHEVWWFKKSIFVTFRFLVHQKSPSLSPDSIFQSFIPDEQSLSEWLPDIFWPKAIQGAQKAESVEQEYLSQLNLSSQVTLYIL